MPAACAHPITPLLSSPVDGSASGARPGDGTATSVPLPRAALLPAAQRETGADTSRAIALPVAEGRQEGARVGCDHPGSNLPTPRPSAEQLEFAQTCHRRSSDCQPQSWQSQLGPQLSPAQCQGREQARGSDLSGKG